MLAVRIAAQAVSKSNSETAFLIVMPSEPKVPK
jgi:hypothetical protein